MPEFLHCDHVNPVCHIMRECAHIRPRALCCATGFLKSINLKVLSPQYVYPRWRSQRSKIHSHNLLTIHRFSLLCLAYGFHALCRAARFLKSNNHKVLSPQYVYPRWRSQRGKLHSHNLLTIHRFFTAMSSLWFSLQKISYFGNHKHLIKSLRLDIHARL
jgi:hypothetical protein